MKMYCRLQAYTQANIHNHAPGVCVILYADDILLLAPSVCGLDALAETCEIELNKLDMVINTRKSCCLRI